MPRTGIPGGRTGHDGLPSRLQMVITRGPGVRSAVPAPARLLVVVAAVALGRPRPPRPGQARSGASPPIRRLGLSAGARPPRRPPGGVGLAGMAWGMRRAVPGFKHGAFRAGWPSCPKLARPAPAHAPRPARPECPFPGASPTGPSLAPAGQFTLCRPGKRIGPDPRLYPSGAIHLVPPGKVDRTGSAPVPQGHFRACPAGLGTGANAARTFRQAVGASSSLPDAPTFSCSLHGFSQKLSLDQHVCSIYNNRTPVRI